MLVLALATTLAARGASAQARVPFCGQELAPDARTLSCDATTSFAGSPDCLDLTPLTALPELRVLRVPYAAVCDLAPLTALSHLEEVAVRVRDRGADLGPLTSAPLRVLEVMAGSDARATQLDLSPLGAARGVEVLTASAGELRGLAALASMRSLRVLELVADRADALPSLAAASRLEEVRLSLGTPFDLSGLRGLASLRRVEARRGITSLAGLETAAGLEQLTVRDAGLRTIDELRGAAQLTYLALIRTEVRELAPLVGASRLETLILDGSAVVALAPLAELRALRTLEIDSCMALTSLEPLSRMPWLRTISTHGLSGHCEPLRALAAALPGARVGPLCEP